MRTILNRLPRRTLYASIATLLIALVPYAVRSTAAGKPGSSTIYSPVLSSASSDTTTRSLVCWATNISAVSHVISAELLEADGTSLATIPARTVGPGNSVDGGVTGTHIAYCRITVDGLSSDVRGELLLVDNGDGLTLAAVPAY